ncbi:hypothetical protein ACOSP7_013342 [Xanthoceras sorbifolium]
MKSQIRVKNQLSCVKEKTKLSSLMVESYKQQSAKKSSSEEGVAIILKWYVYESTILVFKISPTTLKPTTVALKSTS